MISNILRMLGLSAFLGILLFVIGINTSNKPSQNITQGFVNYKSLTERRSIQLHQQYAPNVIYLGENQQNNSGLVNLRSRIR